MADAASPMNAGLTPWTALAEDGLYLDGSRSLCSTEEAMSWSIAAGLAVGVSRVSDLTDLHPMRIPVTQAMRPATRGEVRTMGKGIDRDGAVIGALMEAVERASAEVDLDSASIELCDDLDARVPTDLLPRPRKPRALDASVPWIRATELGSDARRSVPLEIVSLSWLVPEPEWAGRFRATSNGLAAGFTRTSAVLQGLCEVIERDAMALWDLGTESERAATRIRLGSIRDPRCQALLRAMVNAGLWVAVWNLTSDVGVPVVHVGTVAKDPASLAEGEVPAAGVGCHPDPVIATIRALCEAAQSRVSALHGMDEMGPDAYANAHELRAGVLSLMAEQPALEFGELPDLSATSPALELDAVRGLVRRNTGRDVLVVDLTQPGLPPVVKVVVPGMESSIRLPGWSPGPRARQLIGDAPVFSAAATVKQAWRSGRPIVVAPRGPRTGGAVLFVHRDRIPSGVLASVDDVELRPAARPGDLVRAIQAGASAIAVADIHAGCQPALRTSEGLHVLRAGVPLAGGVGLGSFLAADLSTFGAEVIGATAKDATAELVVEDNQLYRLDDSLDVPTARRLIQLLDLDADIAGALVEVAAALPWRLRTLEALARALDERSPDALQPVWVEVRRQLFERDLAPVLDWLRSDPTPAHVPLPTVTMLWDTTMAWIAPEA